ncbi:cysteine proteinase [Peniophora sp. CONT]|nr:cysteine proteinase [Peniophora sp. CONT]
MLTQELSTSRRPAKDKAAFYALLPPAVEFVQGSSTGTLVVGHTKLKPINAIPESQTEVRTWFFGGGSYTHLRYSQTRRRLANAVASSSGPSSSSSNALDTTWSFQEIGAGLNNTGNTCFLNSALQCLIHTAPLANVIKAHECAYRIAVFVYPWLTNSTGRVRKGFCMSCGLKAVVMDSLINRKRSLTPSIITNGLKSIAKHMVRGRQEDSHEFLRFAVDALQKSCLVGYGPCTMLTHIGSKPDPKIAESTWVHQIFGGRLRSRVTCSQCKHNSDTYDNILDLSLEINGTRNINEALRKFTKVDHLTGQNKYKCEKCKKLVSAQKRFTVDQAPNVLTIHLKRFSPLGRKIGNQVDYDQHLLLDDVMSEKPPAPLDYTLYGVICHAGGGPNSGHYYAFVKGGLGAWYEMNDESVSRSRPATSLKSAYILFYIRNSTRPNGVLKRPIASAMATPKQTPVNTPDRQKGVVAAMGKKRKSPDSATPEPAAKKPFIGPQRPAENTSTPSKFKKVGEHAPKSASPTTAKATAAAAAALGSLAAYDDGDADEDVGEKMDAPESAPSKPEVAATSPAPAPRPRPSTPGPIAPSNFYGSAPSAGAKRKAEDDLREKSGLPKAFTGKQVTYGKRARKSSNFKKLNQGVTAM